jgi:predicted Zn-dependent protease
VGLFTLVQALFGDLTGVAATLTEGGAELLTLRFSRDFEREADDEGWSYLLAAGIDPSGMLSFFEKLRAQEEQDDTVNAQVYLSFLSTHPTTPERIERLSRKLQEIPAAARFSPIDVDFRAFQEALRSYQFNSVTEGEETNASQD